MDDGGLCESCATVLPPADVDGLSVCPSCGRVDRSVADERARLAAEQAKAEADRPQINSSITIDLGDLSKIEGLSTFEGTGEAVKDAAVTTAKVGCIVPIIIFVVMGIIGFSVFRSLSSDNAFKSIIDSATGKGDLLPLSSSVMQAQTDAKGTTDLVLEVQDNGASERMVMRMTIGPDGTKELWRSKPLPANAYNLTTARAGNTLFVGAADQLRALDWRTGEERWRTTLSDKVENACESCFDVVGDGVLVRTTDAVISMYGPTSSEARWSRRLASAQGRASVVNGAIYLVDDAAKSSDPAPVATLDPPTGKVLRSAAPTCKPADGEPWTLAMDAGDRVHGVPGTKDLVAAFGFGSTCVMRWDPATGGVRWARALADISSFDQDKVVVQGKWLVLASSSGSYRVDLSSGQPLALAKPADANPEGRARVFGGVVVVPITSTRGSTKAGFAGWDLASGRLLWSVLLKGDSHIMDTDANRSSTTLFPGATGSVLVANRGQARLVTFAENKAMLVQDLNLRTGDLGSPDARNYAYSWSGTPSITWEHDDPDAILVNVDSKLQRIPLTGTGKIVTYG